MDGFEFEGVVAVCTRGILITQVLDGIISNMMSRVYRFHANWTIRTTSELAIPDAQNNVTKQALALRPDFIWYVEEDTVPPRGILHKMILLAEEADVVVANYKLEDGTKSIRKLGNRILYSGMGCMLVRADLFSEMPEPWFESKNWIHCPDGWGLLGGSAGYGKQDVTFCVKLSAIGARVVEVPGELCKHLRFEEPGEWHKNNGVHKFREL